MIAGVLFALGGISLELNSIADGFKLGTPPENFKILDAHFRQHDVSIFFS